MNSKFYIFIPIFSIMVSSHKHVNSIQSINYIIHFLFTILYIFYKKNKDGEKNHIPNTTLFKQNYPSFLIQTLQENYLITTSLDTQK